MTGTGESGGGWTLDRILGLVFGLVGMVGFGGCSLWFFGTFWPGLDMTMSGRGFLSRLFGTVTNDWQAALMFFGGMVISFFCFRLALTMVRRARGMPRK